MRDELRKTILYVENGVGFGGAVISLRAFLANADLERFPAVLVHSLDDPKFASFASNVATVRLPKVILGEAASTSFARKANFDVLWYAARLMRIARKVRAACLYLNNDLVTNLAGLIAGRALRLPVIQHERDIPRPISRLATSLSSKASRVLAISGPVRAALHQMGYPAERIRMVPEGLELDHYKPLSETGILAMRESLGLRSNTKVVVIVGMVMDWKGQHVLVDAAPMVIERHRDTRFLIVGESPAGAASYAEALRAQVRRLGLERSVVFAGYRGNVPAVLQCADVVVHASTSPEPFGRVVIEGMVMRKPVIATNIGAPPEIIRNGDTGYLVQPSDPRQLANVINLVLDNPRDAEAMGDRAHAEVVGKYSIERHVALIESVFEELFWGAPRALPSPALAIRQ